MVNLLIGSRRALHADRHGDHRPANVGRRHTEDVKSLRRGGMLPGFPSSAGDARWTVESHRLRDA
jgi:hypothetical protein